MSNSAATTGIELILNGTPCRVFADPAMPLLWALRDRMGLKATKYGCGIGGCGICVVHLDERARLACGLTLGDVRGRRVTTIEGLAYNHPVIRAWLDEGVAQCGYCQPGQIMAAAALLARDPDPDDQAIKTAMAPVLCRCGTYLRIRKAIRRAGRDIATPFATPPPDNTGANVPQHSWEFGPWIRIAADGRITVVIDRSEMGQGIVTSLAALVAEELEVRLDNVETRFAPADPAYFNPAFGEQHTSGSNSISTSWIPLRRAGAEARERLRAAAAVLWQVPIDECVAEDGWVMHSQSGLREHYGSLAAEATSLSTPAGISLKRPEDFRLLGKSLRALDGRQRTVGAARYGLDVDIPGKLVAVLARPPRPGARLLGVDPSASQAIPGVREVITVEAGVAVIAEDTWSALRGHAALEVTWSTDTAASAIDRNSEKSLHSALETGRGKIVRQEGELPGAFQEASQVVIAQYDTPYLAHASMEPMNCTVSPESSGWTVWVPTQRQTAAKETAARALGTSPDQVDVQTTYLGGGFGRRLDQDYVAEAAALAKAVGGTVQLLWTRKDDFQHDLFRPANVAWLQGAIDASGKPTAWRQRIAGPRRALRDVIVDYAIPNMEIELIETDPGFATGAWRSVGSSQNAFSIECFIDELATAGSHDPVQLRCELLRSNPRALGVLELAAQHAGWDSKLRKNSGRGAAIFQCRGTWIAMVVEAVPAEHGCRVKKVVCAVDCGFVINPDGAVAQIEGGVAFALSAALREQVIFCDGVATARSFREYPILALGEMPEVEVHFVPSKEPPTGVGEAPVPPLAPALANAIFDAVGIRIRKLPLFAVK